MYKGVSMKLICIRCGNYTHFEIDVEIIKELVSEHDSLLVDNAIFSDFDYTEETLRKNLQSHIKFIMEQSSSDLHFDCQSETYYSGLNIHCAKCGSLKINIPSKNYKQLTLEEELKHNREEFQNLRKVRKSYENKLPVLWQP